MIRTLKSALFLICLCSVTVSVAQRQNGYWQQHVDYTMEIDMNVKNFNYTGKQTLVYTNNSPDTLDRVYYHLYFNAFQPGSEMDVRSRTIADADPRVGDRINKLTKEEIGFLNVNKLTQDGKSLKTNVAGTVLEVRLTEPIAPGTSTTFNMDFNGQVPLQVRRSGRDNKEGISLSMTQWYPKLAEYDFEGWHADPYIGREFHGVWGDFDVKITLDSNYTIGGTGYLQNPNEIGHGYEDNGIKVSSDKKKNTWHFKAPKVHDFTWAADPDYIHDRVTAKDGTELHFFYQDDAKIKENWKNLQPKTEEILAYFNEHIGQYPYKQYSVIQGGDGGMEYAMCTLITGDRKFESLVGVTAHEMAHTWFQFLLATNEGKHEWMDEGFTSYISSHAMDEIMGTNKANPADGSYRGYTFLANSGKEQPQSTHADRYEFNQAYGLSAYSKGAVFLAQLGYVIGEENRDDVIKKYYDQWKFKHPTPTDFIRVAEKHTGAELDWYLMDWTQTTNKIDYAIDTVQEIKEGTKIVLKRKGLVPMPIDLKVTFTDGSSKMMLIPLQMMRWEKPFDGRVLNDWAWAMPTYDIILKEKNVQQVEIDPSGLLADVNKEDNTYTKE
ncbi:M1 family metallopeptidase [Gangjinia marincola]|uniref:M1 family metallopeptidase n=1 Tax=Gangjinia marincola TaxID=578463 RepID=A0ABN1MHR8_9FLAO